ncbi:hypothetical protein SAMN05216411_10454 [Nitrosospira multiformis]|nr:hypothetical protein SAMN05216411_10454 [Nitrosospira multiformis]
MPAKAGNPLYFDLTTKHAPLLHSELEALPFLLQKSGKSRLARDYSSMTTKVPVMRYIRINIDPARIFFAHGTVQIIHGKEGVISMAGIAKWRLA